MSTTLPIKKTESIFDELEQMNDRVMRRAYEIFDNNGHNFGRDLDDWFQAERELVWKPSIELEEKDNKFLLQIAVPGVEPRNLDIEVTAEDILVKGSIQHDHKESKGEVHACEFASGNLFRSVHLPKNIDPNKVKAEFKDGMLNLTAEIANKQAPRKIELLAS